MKKFLKIFFVLFSIFAMVIGAGISVETTDAMVVVNAAQGDVTTHSFLTSIPSGWTTTIAPQKTFDSSRGAQFLNKSIGNTGVALNYATDLIIDQVIITAATNGSYDNTSINSEEYLKHEILGTRLLEITRALLDSDITDATTIFGYIDAIKLLSSMTLFAKVKEAPLEFLQVIDKLYKRKPDIKTLEILKG